MRLAPIVLAALFVAAPAAAQEAPPPSDDGTTWLVTGGILATLSIPAFAVIKPCLAMADTRTKAQISADSTTAPGTNCAWTAGGAGMGLFAIGAPLLTIGIVKRAAWLRGLEVAPARTGASVSWATTF